MSERIQLAHGGGGTLMHQLIERELKALYTDPAAVLHDAAAFDAPAGRLAFTTDGYVVQPLEFPGGDIGSLAITGTANDLAMAGARPLRLSVGLILEEGLELELLRRVVQSMRQAAEHCAVQVVTGDTKVVERSKADGVFITTSGIGVVEATADPHPTAIRPGDQLLVSGDLGRHGVAILAARHGLALHPPVLSDCAPLWPLVQQLLAAGVQPHCLRDLTRGGLASALQELAAAAGAPLRIEEEQLPVIEPVRRTCELLGFDPLHLANEGRFLAVVAPEQCEAALQVLEPGGGSWIGEVLTPPDARAARLPGVARVLLRTGLGTQRVLLPLSGELLPRIC
jgi:hydrogenase expression/formation protein HypE